MKASRFSDAQKAFILKQGSDGMPVGDICRKAGISQATYFNWKRKYDGLLPTEMRRREAEMKQILKWLVGLYLVIAVVTFSKSRNATQFVLVSADAG
jgi:putative transposase